MKQHNDKPFIRFLIPLKPGEAQPPEAPEGYKMESDAEFRERIKKDISWDEFEQKLIKAGWSPEDAKKEREANEFGDLGDCDGDLEP